MFLIIIIRLVADQCLYHTCYHILSPNLWPLLVTQNHTSIAKWTEIKNEYQCVIQRLHPSVGKVHRMILKSLEAVGYWFRVIIIRWISAASLYKNLEQCKNLNIPICGSDYFTWFSCKTSYCLVKRWSELLLTHWGRDEMAAIIQTTVSNAFP